jgi:tetratricopeptide (TPR) repeat protein
VAASTADFLKPLARLECKVHAGTTIAGSIALQAFDIAVVALAGNKAADTPATPAEARRILATILVNCGWHHEALQQLDLATGLARSDPGSVSRILYTKGLVLAKRMAAIDEAEKLFYEGIRLLAEHGLIETPDGRLSHAWHLNGLALIAALRARLAADKLEKNKMLALAASFLKRARPLVTGGGSQPAIYLEDNLTANGVMLREMNGEYDAARRRFVEKFARFANAQSARQPFVFYHFRVAGLKYRAGDASGALEDLVESRNNAVACQAEHAISRIDLASSIVLSSLGRLDEACDSLDLAIVDAEERDAFGLLATIANQARSISLTPGDRADLLQKRAAASLGDRTEQQRPVPAFPSKLPSYVPFIDLLCDTDSTNEKLTAPRQR